MSRHFLSGKSFASVMSLASLIATSVLLSSCMRGDGFDWGRLVIASAINGKILDRGKPVANATVTRKVEWRWGEDTYTDTTTTDKEGRFSFDTLKKFAVAGNFLPHEPYIDHSYFVRVGNEEVFFLYRNKRGYDYNDELIANHPAEYYVGKRKLYEDSLGRKYLRNPKEVNAVTCQMELQPSCDYDQ
jgi:hypothetical protein